MENKRNPFFPVKAIIWNISPSVRRTHELQEQANFIDQLSPRDIWNNVIIICKEATVKTQNFCTHKNTFDHIEVSQFLGSFWGFLEFFLRLARMIWTTALVCRDF